MIDGMISIRQKDQNVKDKNLESKKISFKYAGEVIYDSQIDSHVPEVKKEILGKHDSCLRKFQYSKALDSVMLSYIINRSPHVIVAVFQELIRRQGIIQALAERDGKSLFNILKFIIRHIGCERFKFILLHVTSFLLGEIYF